MEICDAMKAYDDESLSAPEGEKGSPSLLLYVNFVIMCIEILGIEIFRLCSLTLCRIGCIIYWKNNLSP